MVAKMKTVRLQIWLSHLIKAAYFTLNAKEAIVQPQNNYVSILTDTITA